MEALTAELREQGLLVVTVWPSLRQDDFIGAPTFGCSDETGSVVPWGVGRRYLVRRRTRRRLRQLLRSVCPDVVMTACDPLITLLEESGHSVVRLDSGRPAQPSECLLPSAGESVGAGLTPEPSFLVDGRRPMRLGIVSTEFFDDPGGGKGGFGWATRAVARVVQQRDDIELTYVLTTRRERVGGYPSHFGGVPTLVVGASKAADRRALADAGLDLLLTIDYRPLHRLVYDALPEVPVVVWSRDPRSPSLRAEIAGLRCPDQQEPAGGQSPDTVSFRHVLKASRSTGRPILLATVASALVERIPASYDIEPTRVWLLPNPLDVDSTDGSAPLPGGLGHRPLVLFLGRLDPLKRPWIFVELARSLPDYDFAMLGAAYVTGPQSWRPDAIPPNLTMVGHVDGPLKQRFLDEASLLVNCSISEGLAVSFLEALAHETPIVSCVDTSGVVSQFGRFVGHWPGDGRGSGDAFRRAVSELIEHDEERRALGRAGRAWVEERHRTDLFVAGLARLAAASGALCTGAPSGS